MAYDKTNWVNDETPLNAENMNKIEQGIADSVSQEDFDNLVNNVTQIEGENNTIKLGGASATNAGESCVVIGKKASVSGNYGVAIGRSSKGDGGGTAIGAYAIANNFGSIAIGSGLSSGPEAKANYAVQIGQGTNRTQHSLQIEDDNIYKTDTHTLTVNNIEQNGNPVYAVLQGTTAPDTTTVGAVTSFYLNTTDKKLYQCVEIDNTTSSYTWQAINRFTPQELTLTESSNVLTSAETFTTHTQILVEFETDGIHAGFDCILHPYNQAICMISYNVLTNGTPHFGTCYLDNTSHVVINIPTGMTFTNVKAHYIALE